MNERTHSSETSRRNFLRNLGVLTAGASVIGPDVFSFNPTAESADLFFKISLAEWSLNGSLKSSKLTNLDFPAKAKRDFGISAVEYVNTFFKDKAENKTYLNELNMRCSDQGVRSMLIMCDEEGALADQDSGKRQVAVTNHFKWVDAAHTLGCHSIRVNCHGAGTPEEVAMNGMDGLRKLSEYGKQAGINVIVENHGGLSSNGAWLTNVIKSVGMQNCGTLPDFGNFSLGNNEWYDRYKGVEEMMPYAKAVSAKALDFDEQGNCVETDYSRMLPLVKAAGYRGFIGIEYGGSKLSEDEGIRATKRLLERVGAAM